MNSFDPNTSCCIHVVSIVIYSTLHSFASTVLWATYLCFISQPKLRDGDAIASQHFKLSLAKHELTILATEV